MKKNRNKPHFSRREFLSTSAKGAAVLSASGFLGSCSFFAENKVGEIPKRILGKTGLAVSILSFGGGSQFLKNKNGVWEKTIEKALASGINLFDTAPSYTVSGFNMGGDNKAMSSEERFGEFLPAYRDKVVISTKLEEREVGLARKSVETSLKNMKTDYLDMLLIHAINDKDDVLEIEKGIYKEILELKNEGIIRNIGFSSMDSAQRSKDLLENLDFDVAMLATNPTQYGNYAEVAIPVAKAKNVGIIAIKVVRGLVGNDVTAKELLEYAWTTNHVDTAMIGHFEMETLEENIKLALNYGKTSKIEIDIDELEARMASYAGPHALPWARPGYIDGGIVV